MIAAEGLKNPALPGYRGFKHKKSVGAIRLLPIWVQFFLDDCVAKVFNMQLNNSSLVKMDLVTEMPRSS